MSENTKKQAGVFGSLPWLLAGIIALVGFVYLMTIAGPVQIPLSVRVDVKNKPQYATEYAPGFFLDQVDYDIYCPEHILKEVSHAYYQPRGETIALVLSRESSIYRELDTMQAELDSFEKQALYGARKAIVRISREFYALSEFHQIAHLYDDGEFTVGKKAFVLIPAELEEHKVEGNVRNSFTSYDSKSKKLLIPPYMFLRLSTQFDNINDSVASRILYCGYVLGVQEQ